MKNNFTDKSMLILYMCTHIMIESNEGDFFLIQHDDKCKLAVIKTNRDNLFMKNAKQIDMVDIDGEPSCFLAPTFRSYDRLLTPESVKYIHLDFDKTLILTYSGTVYYCTYPKNVFEVMKLNVTVEKFRLYEDLYLLDTDGNMWINKNFDNTPIHKGDQPISQVNINYKITDFQVWNELFMLTDDNLILQFDSDDGELYEMQSDVKFLCNSRFHFVTNNDQIYHYQEEPHQLPYNTCSQHIDIADDNSLVKIWSDNSFAARVFFTNRNNVNTESIFLQEVNSEAPIKSIRMNPDTKSITVHTDDDIIHYFVLDIDQIDDEDYIYKNRFINYRHDASRFRTTKRAR